MLINKNFFSKINILNYLISSIPLSLIIGNLATNLNIILICLTGLWLFGRELFFVEKKINYLLCLFFIYLIIITTVNNYVLLNKNELYLDHIFKSFFFLRFLLLFLIINKLIEKNHFNTKIFYISCAFFSLIVAIDITIQFIFKYNILGNPIVNNKPSGFFKEENIAGGFLQKFILFFIFLTAFKKKGKNYYILIIGLSILCFLPILFTANRMPTILFIFSIILYFLLEKKLKHLFLILIILIAILFSSTKIIISERLHMDTRAFISDSVNIISSAPRLFIYNNLDNELSWGSGYLTHFNSGVQQWKQNKIFGKGLKSFRLNCSYAKNQTCNTHPHNYFIELMVDTGLIGLTLIYSIFLIGLKKFIKFYFNEMNTNIKLTTIVFFLLIFCEFFPIRSTGSFFTTNNATFIFLILPIFLNFKKIQKLD